jgi:hypothetical protein
MSEERQQFGDTVVVYVTYDHPAHVESIRAGMETELPSPSILEPVIGELPSLVMACSVAIKVLVHALIDWQRHVKDVADLRIEADPEEEGSIDVRSQKSDNPGRIVVVDRSGEEKAFDSPSEQMAQIEAAINGLRS